MLWIGIAATAVMILIAAVAFLTPSNRGYLTLRDSKTGELYARFPADNGTEFSIAFVHSVNQAPVKDVFVVKDKTIQPVETIFFAFGAGMQTDLQEGQKLVYHDDGSMSIIGFDQSFDQLNYIVGTVSDHILWIGGREESLRELCGKNAAITIKAE